MTTAEAVERATMTTKREEWTVCQIDSRDVVDAYGMIVATAYAGESLEEDARLNNARRIAAVPDMEAALLATAGYFRDVGRALPCWCGLGARTHRPHDSHCESAFAALRKAGRL